MVLAKKQPGSRRQEVINLVKAHPGITSIEVATKLGLASSTRASTALWPAIKRGHIVAERIVVDGKTMNAHYHADQVPPDAVERIQQKLVDASEVIPMSKATGARTSVFDVPSQLRRVRQRPKKKNSSPPATTSTPPLPTIISPRAPSGFACAVTNDGTLVLMRAGEIKFLLTDIEAATLQSYLLKRAAASLITNMAIL